uniref:Orc1-like AAA ATPase domain-containing protein n=1 Tax=Amphora coffeiformis TaxID=265554 RepID=A0A7S3L7F6_9STRA
MNDRQTKLDFSRLGHFGRSSELSQLVKLCRRRPRPSESSSPTDSGDDSPLPNAVVIEAESGTGKSVLLNALCSELISSWSSTSSSSPPPQAAGCSDNIGHFCCRGKFEERTAASEPFDALRDAMDEILDDFIRQDQVLKDSGGSSSSSHAERLRNALGPDLGLLALVLPKLHTILSANEETKSIKLSKHSVPSINLENLSQLGWQFERLRFAFRSFVRYASKLKSVILILDDLHWCDPDSLQIILTLVQDKVPVQGQHNYDNRSNARSLGFIFVGASRPLAGYECLKSHLDKLPRNRLAIMTISSMSTEGIASICRSLLQMEGCDDRRTAIEELASCILELTGGNTFVVLQYLRLMEQKNLIQCSDGAEGWTWDLDNIRQAGGIIHETVTHVVADNIKKLEPSIKLALIVASAFGVSQFDLATIVHAAPVVEGQDGTEHMEFLSELSCDFHVAKGSMEGLSVHISKAVHDGLLIKDSTPGRYHFAHDRIREAAYSLLPEGEEGKEMHLAIGRQLRSWIETQGELGAIAYFSDEQLLLHAVKQLNMGKELMTDSWEKLDLADLCFNAAELAAQQSSFSSSMNYLQQGLECLPENAWKWHYDLTLKFKVALMRMQYSLVHLDDCMKTADEILLHTRGFQDTKGIYHTQMLCMLQQHRARKGMDLAISVLKTELNVKLPRRFILPRAIAGYIKIARRLRKTSDEEILAIPVTTDVERLQDIMDLFNRIVDLAFHEGTDDCVAYGILLGIAMMEFVFEYGLFASAFIPMAYFAQISFVFGDFASAERCFNFSELLIEAAKKNQNRNIAVVATRYGWGPKVFNTVGTTPLNTSIVPICKALNENWELGSLDWSFLDFFGYLRHLFCSGRTLALVADECSRCSEILCDYKQSLQWLNNAPLHQAILILIGDEANMDPTRLVGSHLTSDSHFDSGGNDTETRLARFQHHFYTMFLSYHFDDFEKAKQMIKLFPTDIWSSGIAFAVPFRVFYSGLVYAALCRTKSHKRLKYRRRAQAAFSQIDTWCSKGAVNCQYMRHILEAELIASSTRRKKDARAVLLLYDKAIEEAKKIQALHHIALANELAGNFAKTRGGSVAGEAKRYLTEASNFYEKWGATTKVQHLRKFQEDTGIPIVCSTTQQPQSSLSFAPEKAS